MPAKSATAPTCEMRAGGEQIYLDNVVHEPSARPGTIGRPLPVTDDDRLHCSDTITIFLVDGKATLSAESGLSAFDMLSDSNFACISDNAGF